MSVRKTAGRVEPSQITSFLCFTCGDVFNNNVEYHRHLMEHQAVSLIYQLYYLEHEYKNLTPEERLARKQESPAPSMSARRNTDPGKNLPIDAGKRHIRYSEDTEVKADTKNGRAKPNTQETVKPPVKAVRRGSFNVGAPPSKKSKLAKDDTASVLKFSNSKGYLLMKTHEMFCHICPGNPSFKFPLNALSHWVTEHNATISRTELQFFSQNVLQQSITNSPGTACPVCDMEFSQTVGYLHALEHHLAELVETLISVKKVEMVDELIINVSATLPSQPEAVIRISANVVQK